MCDQLETPIDVRTCSPPVPREVIAVAVRWYLRYGLSYRDLEELLAERGVDVDHVTIYRWVYSVTISPPAGWSPIGTRSWVMSDSWSARRRAGATHQQTDARDCVMVEGDGSAARIRRSGPRARQHQSDP